MQLTLLKIDEIFPLAIPNQISTISMHTKFAENLLMFTQVIIWKQKYGCMAGR